MPAPQIELIGIGLFAGMLCLLEAGRKIGRRLLRRHREESVTLFPALEGSVFGLMALLVAFAFAGAASRFEMKRELIVEEANAIGTAWLRLDLLPASRQGAIRENFKCYVDSRLAFYRNITNETAAQQSIGLSTNLQRQIWSGVVTAGREATSPAATILVIPSLNAMFDIMNSRVAAARTHSPVLIRVLLITLPLVCSLLAGMNLASRARRSWVHILGFAAIISIVVYVILDFDSPRRGLIRLEMHDQALVEVRNGLQETIPDPQK